jgi:DNA-binding PadR family transcriptional regulator
MLKIIPINRKALLLQALTTGPSFGMELADKIDRLTGDNLSMSSGTLYPALQELEDARLIARCAPRGMKKVAGRPLIYYRLTPLGRKQAKENRAMIAAFFGLVIPTNSHARSTTIDTAPR